MRATTQNRFLNGNFAPVTEEGTAFDLPVTGEIPDHLDGRYVRNGPNPVGEVDPATYHWFVGDGMLHGVRLRDGKAEWYRNRWVRSAGVARALGEQPRPGPVFGVDFAANTSVLSQAGRTFAIVEGGFRPYEVTDELDTVGPCDFGGTLPGGYTAHPKRDPGTGELHAVSYFWGWGNRVQYSVLDTAARIRRTVDIEVGGSPMMHDFSLTEGHAVLYDLPVTFDLDFVAAQAPQALRRPVRAAARRIVGRHRLPDRVTGAMMRSGGESAVGTMPYAWNPDYPARVGVLPRDGSATDVRWFDVEPCYVFHPLNAYDEGDRIVLDVVRYERMFDRRRHGPDEARPTLDRWTVDLAAGKVLEERLDDRGQEFPQVDPRCMGRRHRFGYAVAFDLDGGDMGGRLIRHDFGSGTSVERSFGPGRHAGEFVFVPDRHDAPEDDGTVMGYVYDEATDRSELVLLDAATLETVGTVHLPARVPHGFHGNWLPSAG